MISRAEPHNSIVKASPLGESFRHFDSRKPEENNVDRDSENTARGVVISRSSFARILKTLVYFVYLYSGYIALRDLVLSLLGRSRAVVVYYHRVGGRGVLSKPLDQFRADLDYLRKHYECITLAALSRRLKEGGPLRRRVAALTFDDGYRDNYVTAVPALEDAGLTATFFVATGYVGTRREFPHDHRCDAAGTTPDIFPKLEWDDLREMERNGFEIGSHTVNHTNLGNVEASGLHFEIESSLNMLDAQLEQKPRPFSFPWGKPGDICDQALQIIRDAGYYAACSAHGGANTRNGDPFHITRIDVGNRHLSQWETRARIAGLDLAHLRLRMERILEDVREAVSCAGLQRRFTRGGSR